MYKSGHQIRANSLQKFLLIQRIAHTQGTVQTHAAKAHNGLAVGLHLTVFHMEGKKLPRGDGDKLQ